MENLTPQTELNTFSKYAPNVFVAKCTNQHQRGDIIILTTKYGKEIENEVHNFLGKTKDGFFLYSITRVDGFNSQERAKNKAEKLIGYSNNAEVRSTQYYEASKEGKDFLSLAEPIKIGHHSERRHRKLIERNWERMGKSIQEDEKAKEYSRRAEYWKEKANKIDLSMPDSLEYFEFELEKAKKEHQLLKDNPEKRAHSMSLQYANKKVKELEKTLYTAVLLWGDDEEIQQLQKEKQENEIKKVTKSDKINDIIKKYGGFFAFNNEQFAEGKQKVKQEFNLSDDEKITSFGMGLYIPSRFADDFHAEYKKY